MTRISKTTARKMFNEGNEIWICACNMQPKTGILLNISNYTGLARDFDRIVNAFQYYNCNNECGRYPAYYIGEQPLFFILNFCNFILNLMLIAFC